MPQIWLTYDEIAHEIGCASADARAEVIARAWPRRRCGDGLTRVKLPPNAAAGFIDRMAAAKAITEMRQLAERIEDLARRMPHEAGDAFADEAVRGLRDAARAMRAGALPALGDNRDRSAAA